MLYNSFSKLKVKSSSLGDGSAAPPGCGCATINTNLRLNGRQKGEDFSGYLDGFRVLGVVALREKRENVQRTQKDLP